MVFSILSIDLEKAFDRVSHQYLFKLLECLGFKGNFLTFIKAMYMDITSQVEVNGKMTRKIKIGRSVRQGCSLSMLLFILSTIPILNAIEKDTKIRGFKTKYGNEIKALAYADDTTIIIQDTRAIDRIEHLFKDFGRASEAKINIAKTEILRLGKWKNNMPNYNIYKDKIKPQVKILGIIYTETWKDFTHTNWQNKILKIDRFLNFFKNRELSLFGKVLLTNSLILSQLWHIGCVVELSKVQINLLYNKLNVWINGKNSTNIIPVLMKSKENGGAGLLDVEKRMKTIKVKALQFLLTGIWSKAFDIILYWAGTRLALMSGKTIIGPKAEICNNKYEKTIKTLFENRDKLQEINDMKLKDVEHEIFGKAINEISYKNIYFGKSVYFISLNFKIATNILKTAVNRNEQNRACSICHSRNETIYHLFLECELLEPLRNHLMETMKLIRGANANIKLDWNLVINMQGLEKEMEYETISIYKKTIWNQATKIRFDNKQLSLMEMRLNFEKEIHFYFRYIYDNG